MPDISVTDDQRERLDRVRAHLAEDVAYGHVRPRDALEYLLDQYEVEFGQEATVETSASAPASGDGDRRDEGSPATEFEVRNAGGATASVGVTDDGDSASASDSDDDGGDGDEDEAAEVTATQPGDENEDARLNSVMSLLDDNDDVWREASGGEEKYEVDLPDGGTERARTKDDVRAVLFKHYR